MTKTREFWRNIAANDYAVPAGEDVMELTAELLTYLASPDPELRDEIAYLILAYWIDRLVYPTDQLRAMLDTMAHNLQHGLGEIGTDSIFMRSFSMLILGSIINHDNEAPFLGSDDIKKYLQLSLDYLSAEKDIRGYIQDKGWAHTIAHTADTLLYFAQNRYVGGKELEDILITISMKITEPIAYVYEHNEDERLALAVLAVIERNLLDMRFYERWFEAIALVIKNVGFNVDVNGQSQNTKNFLRSIYFQLVFSTNPAQHIREVRQITLNAIQTIHRFLH